MSGYTPNFSNPFDQGGYTRINNHILSVRVMGESDSLNNNEIAVDRDVFESLLDFPLPNDALISSPRDNRSLIQRKKTDRRLVIDSTDVDIPPKISEEGAVISPSERYYREIMEEGAVTVNFPPYDIL